MLALSRKFQERIVIPELGVTIVVTKISTNRVTLAIEAPKHIKILRGELLRPREPRLPNGTA